MKYRWKEKELLKGLKEAISHDNIETIENYEFMLSILRDINTSDIPTVTNNYNALLNHYTEDINCIEEPIFDKVLELYKIVNDEQELYDQEEPSKFDLKNKELVELGREIIESLGDQKALDIYKEITNKHNHLLHIVDDDNIQLDDDMIYGTSIRDYVNVKPYILLKRRHNVHDIEVFIHEVMHSIIFVLNHDKSYPFNYFQELEGRYGERLSSNFLKEHGMKKQANEIDEYNLTITLYQSFMLYLSDILFYNAKNGSFDLQSSNKMLQEETPFKDTIIIEDSIKDIVRYSAFYIITNAIDYLISLELSNKYSPNEQYIFIKQLCNMESYNFYNQDMMKTFDFLNDNNKQLIDEKRRIEQAKRIRI